MIAEDLDAIGELAVAVDQCKAQDDAAPRTRTRCTLKDENRNCRPDMAAARSGICIGETADSGDDAPLELIKRDSCHPHRLPSPWHLPCLSSGRDVSFSEA